MNTSVKDCFENLRDSELSMNSFSFYTSVSAVFSSKIEGEEIELDSFIKHKRLGVEYQPHYTHKIDDLYGAYEFAQSNPLTPQNLMRTHALLTKNILPEKQQMQLRKGNMFVVTDDGRIEYVAAAPGEVPSEMAKFYADLDTLLEEELEFDQVFFFASMLHLVFVKIHPFDDGNGRTARLLEKWFLAQKLGGKAWFVQSEKEYYKRHGTYYANIRRLGIEYEHLDYAQSLSFILMLPQSITNNQSHE
ncbi:Fic family protein [uncultured Flavobacterium sp.]|uniref:Fic family protein n=1 Tax=uncultured Flavobacterium sp. TaxID=165435 RepID=UPI0025E01721|nr:Fic family protein [uncultured Flavobacterium sp.]